jgi:ribosome-associated protein
MESASRLRAARRRMPTVEVNKMLAAAAAACEDKKAEDIRILALDPSESALTDYFLICSGNSDRQNVAITDEIEGRLKRDFGMYPNSVEGRRLGEWVLMDYVDFIVHVFSTEKRAFYALERLRKSATSMTMADLDTLIAGQKSRTKTPRGELKAVVAGDKSATKKSAKKIAAKKSVAKKSSAKKSAAKKSVAKKSPAKKLPTKRPEKKAAKRSPK